MTTTEVPFELVAHLTGEVIELSDLNLTHLLGTKTKIKDLLAKPVGLFVTYALGDNNRLYVDYGDNFVTLQLGVK